MRDKIYLIGQISTNAPETYLWRKKIKTRFKNDKQFYFIDPCKNEYNNDLREKYKDGSDIDRSKVYKTKSIELIVPKDKMYVMKSTIAIANLNHFDPLKPMIGTMFELAWYHDNNHKAVIGIYDGDPGDSMYANHPFVQASINCWTRNVEEAANTLDKYFKI